MSTLFSCTVKSLGNRTWKQFMFHVMYFNEIVYLCEIVLQVTHGMTFAMSIPNVCQFEKVPHIAGKEVGLYSIYVYL